MTTLLTFRKPWVFFVCLSFSPFKLVHKAYVARNKATLERKAAEHPSVVLLINLMCLSSMNRKCSSWNAHCLLWNMSENVSLLPVQQEPEEQTLVLTWTVQIITGKPPFCCYLCILNFHFPFCQGWPQKHLLQEEKLNVKITCKTTQNAVKVDKDFSCSGPFYLCFLLNFWVIATKVLICKGTCSELQDSYMQLVEEAAHWQQVPFWLSEKM